MCKQLCNWFPCIQPYHIFDSSKSHYLLEKMSVNNLEAIQVVFEINLHLS